MPSWDDLTPVSTAHPSWDTLTPVTPPPPSAAAPRAGVRASDITVSSPFGGLDAEFWPRLGEVVRNWTIGPFEQAGKVWAGPTPEERQQALASMTPEERAAYLESGRGAMTPMDALLRPPPGMSDEERTNLMMPLTQLGLLGTLSTRSVGGVPYGWDKGFPEWLRTKVARRPTPAPTPRPLLALPPAHALEITPEGLAVPRRSTALPFVEPTLDVVPTDTGMTPGAIAVAQRRITAPPKATPTDTSGITVTTAQMPEGGHAIPPELLDVSTGKARAFLVPPANEGTVPTIGEQALAGQDLPAVARTLKLSLFTGEDGTKVFYRAKTVPRTTLMTLDKEGRLAEIVNGPGTSPKPTAPTDIVTARTPEGQEIRTILTDTPEKTVAAMNAQPAGTQVEVKPFEEAGGVLQERMQSLRNTIEDAAATQPKLIQTRATMPPEGLQPKAPQAEHGELLRGLTPQEPTRQAGLPLTEGDTTGTLGMGIQIPDNIKEWLQRFRGVPREEPQAAPRPPIPPVPPTPDPFLSMGQRIRAERRAARGSSPTTGLGGDVQPPVAAPPPLTPDLQVPPKTGRWSGLMEALQAQRAKLPSELRVLKQAPESAAISSVEGARATVANGAAAVVKTPWAQALGKYTPEQFKQLENRAVQIWEQGGKTQGALGQAIAAMPPEIQQMLRYRQSRLPIEQAARKLLGLPEIPEVSGPYFPRLTEQGLQDIKSISRGRANLANDLQTTIKSFQQSRFFKTMAEGEAKGMTYQDPRAAWAMREWHSLQLEATARLMQNLEQKGVLFRTAEAAKAASPINRAFGIEGLPGATQWFAPTVAEREFIIQNLGRADRGALGVLISLGNQLFRNPNLFNPAPHFLKNMLYKYAMSGGSLTKVFPAMAEYERGTAPLVQRFKAVFPESETAMSPGQTFDPFLKPDSLVAAGLRGVGKLNQPSSTAIFGHLDPALRYARWKQYVARGMSDQAAANHVQVDLIRYGTRSDAVDFWKSIPLNFFVPWRTGTVTSLVKQVMSHPVRAAAFIGAADYLREARYRKSGQWTHLPIDYVESPVSQIIQHPTPKTTAALAATTLLFGPGGSSTASTLKDALEDIRGGDEWGRVVNMFWGVSQLYNMPKEFQKFQQTGDVNHLVNILTSAAVAEHSALNYEPRRLMAYLPEWLPGMQKSDQVALAEAIQAQRRAKGEAIRARQAIRPRPKIEELLGVSP